MIQSVKLFKIISQMENEKPKEKIYTNLTATTDSNEQYIASYLKSGSASGVMYQMKILTLVTWRLICRKDAKIDKWWLATEVRNACGFHDLVLKYTTNDTPKGDGNTSDRKCMYRFVQIKHKKSLRNNGSITSCHLLSKHKLHRQGSLIHLFKCYIDMLGRFENITPDQIMDLTIYTNMNIEAFKFLVPVEDRGFYGFEGKGKRFCIDTIAIKNQPGLWTCLYKIKEDDKIIHDFLRKLVFIVNQPFEHELEGLIVAEMGKIFNTPQILYDNLYKNIINWFLIYDAGKAPYLTESYIIKRLKETVDTLRGMQKTEMFVESISKLEGGLKLLSL